MSMMLCNSMTIVWFLQSLLTLLPPQSNFFIMDIDHQYNDDKKALLEILRTGNLADAKEAYRQVTLECVKVFVQVAGVAALACGGPLYYKIPFHTSALLGLNWVMKLINGHPEQIQNKLGVHKHVFATLLNKLRIMGFGSSWNIMLEEQLAIFLYTCVAGLSIQHICKRFQHTMDMTSWTVSIVMVELSRQHKLTKLCSCFSRC